MKITKINSKLVIDGDTITTIEIPKDMKFFDIGEWLAERLGHSEYKKEDIKIINFTFISSDESDGVFKNCRPSDKFLECLKKLNEQ